MVDPVNWDVKYSALEQSTLPNVDSPIVMTDDLSYSGKQINTMINQCLGLNRNNVVYSIPLFFSQAARKMIVSAYSTEPPEEIQKWLEDVSDYFKPKLEFKDIKTYAKLFDKTLNTNAYKDQCNTIPYYKIPDYASCLSKIFTSAGDMENLKNYGEDVGTTQKIDLRITRVMFAFVEIETLAKQHNQDRKYSDSSICQRISDTL